MYAPTEGVCKNNSLFFFENLPPKMFELFSVYAVNYATFEIKQFFVMIIEWKIMES